MPTISISKEMEKDLKNVNAQENSARKTTYKKFPQGPDQIK
jgi:hypothetical protein